MKMRTWHVTMDMHEENFSGLRVTDEHEVYRNWVMKPTVNEVRETIKDLASEYEPDERWMTIKEQIDETLGLGFFSISLRRKDRADQDFIAYSLNFMEV